MPAHAGPVVRADPPHADGPLANAAALAGAIAVARRGECTFDEKAARAAAAGAAALVVVNSADEPFPPSGEGAEIHVVGVAAGAAEALAAAAEVSLTIVHRG